MKPPDLSRMPVFVLVARVKIGSLSLPFTGQPFVEASARRAHTRWRGSASLPFTGQPFVEASGWSPSSPMWYASLPFTGQPFVEAGGQPGSGDVAEQVAALHRAALR